MTQWRTDVTRDDILVRDPWCLRCGKQRSVDRQHRIKVAQGRQDTWANQFGVCRSCHDWIGDHEAEAKAKGWTVEPWRLPELVPVETAQHGRALLPPNGIPPIPVKRA